MKVNNKNMQYYLLILFLSIVNVVFSQQDPHYTQYRYNMSVVNPAYAGSREALTINLLGKRQWTGVEGAPTTGTLVIHSPLNSNPNLGLGLTAIYDQAGPVKETNVYADVSYKIDVSYVGSLSFGLKGGISYQTLNESLLNFNNSQSVAYDLNKKASPNFGFGMYYKQDNFYAGLSIPNILQNSFIKANTNSLSEIQGSSNLYITSGYVYELNENIKLKPSVLLKYSTIFPFSFDVSGAMFIQDKLELGTSYRYKESIAFIGAFFVSKHLRIGYAYDYSIGELSTYNNGSHEIMLLFDLGLIGNNGPYVKHF